MATTRYGFGAAVNNTANKFSRNSSNRTHTILSSRVRDIILDDSHPKFKQYGEWNSIGVIFIESAKNPIFSETIDLIPAYPAFPNIKNYPLINELVPILYLSNNNITEDSTSVSAYYLPPINVWNSQIHNAIPSTDVLPDTQKKDYQQTELGSVRRVTDQSTEINLGKTFNENNVIGVHPLLPFEGDIIYEGRYGNSIRLGSTVNNSITFNPWSTVGKNGSPIFIIRNGQSSTSTNSWVPVVEDINNDLSSIYLTSTQQLPLNVSSLNDFSFSKSTSPTDPKQYAGNQIILNSGRLVFNAKSDSILILANKSIQLSCNETLGVDAKQISLTADTVYLGSSEGNEGTRLQSVVLGENLNFVLSDIATFLQTLNIAFKTATDSNGAPIVSLQSIAFEAETLSNDITNIVNNKNLLSKQVKTV